MGFLTLATCKKCDTNHIPLATMSLGLNHFTNSFTKTFIRKKASYVLLMNSRIDFRHDHCKWKILGHQVFRSHLATWNHEILLQSGIGRQIWGEEESYLHEYWNLKFSISALPTEDSLRQNMEKRDNKISCSHLAVNSSQCQASYSTQQPPVSMGRSAPRHGARRKGGCIGKRSESIFRSGEWT